MAAPVIVSWDGEAFVPHRRFQRACDADYVIGQPYQMVVQEERSARSHRHFFASINEAWMNLDDDLAERFPTSESLRKFALIKTGFANSRQIVASSKAEAQRLAAFIRPCDEYALVVVKDAVVTIYTAQSQSLRAMGKDEFKRSKDCVLDYVSNLIGVSPETLGQSRAA